MKLHTSPNSILLMMISFLIGIFLTIVPLPIFAVWLRPQWIFALLLFWIINAPAQCGIGVAFMMGLLLDLITGTPVGEHALVFVVLTYIVLKSHSMIRHLSVWQQAGIIGLLTMVGSMLQAFILGAAGHSAHIMLYALSAITTMLIWPWILTLNHFRPRTFIR